MKVILGTVQLGLDYGVIGGRKPDIETAVSMLAHSYECGVRHLDTASVYGDSIPFIGEYHARFPNKIFKVYSKFLLSDFNTNLDELIERQCSMMKISSLEGIFFHRIDEVFLGKRPESTKTPMGVSIYTQDDLKRVIDVPNLKLIQVPLSIFHHKSELKTSFQDLEQFSFYVRSIFLQGIIFMPRENLKGKLSCFLPALEFLDSVSNELKLSLVELATAYALSLKNVSGVLFGAQTNEQVTETLKYFIKKDIDWGYVLKGMPDIPETMLNPGNWK